MTRRATDERARKRRARNRPDGDDVGVDAVDALRTEPEPDWADAIRRGRRDRAAALRTAFATFDDDETPLGGHVDDVGSDARSEP